MGAPQYEQAGADIGGSGTSSPSTIPRWTGPSTLGDSVITQNTAANAVGVGATVNSTWAAGWRAVQIGQNAAIWADTSVIDGRFSQNVVWTGSAFNYLVNGAALMYVQNVNGHAWSYAGAGTAGNPITFTTGMVLTSAGNVGIGTAGPGSILDVLRTQNSTTNAQVRNLSTGAAAQARMDIVSDASTLLLGVVSSGWTTFGLANGDAYISNNSARIIQFGTGGSERMRISGTAAQVAIGTSSFTSGRALTTVADLDVFGVRVGRGGNASIATNTAVGPNALNSGSAGNRCTAVGSNALLGSTGNDNTGVGDGAGYSVTSAARVTAIGGGSVAFVTGSDNTAVGSNALFGNSGTPGNGASNTAIGSTALTAITTGSRNTAIGLNAGNTTTIGSDCVFIGQAAVASSATVSNEIVIGSGATGLGADTARIGNSSTVSIHLDAKFVRLVDSYTVATLPAAGTAGRIARVTDGDAALAWGATVVNTGAGATPYLVWDNGTNWTVFGK